MTYRLQDLVYGVLLLALMLTACAQAPEAPPPTPTLPPTVEPDAERPLRLFFVRTYGEEDIWSNRIRTGILERLGQAGYDRTFETLVFSEYALDIGTVTDTVQLSARVDAALEEMVGFEPDVVIVADDEGARRVIRGYPDPIQPFVFCGLNGSAWEHGLSRPNVAGVIEMAYPLQTVRLAATMISRDPDDVLFLSDASIASDAATDLLTATLLDDARSPVEELVSRQVGTWPAWQTVVLEETDDFDMLLLGHYSGLVDENGTSVSGQTILQWTLEHSPTPIYGLQLNTIDGGAVGGLVVSGYEQGRAAAELALDIFHGASPDSLPHTQPQRNVLAINVAAARHWDLNVPLDLLVAARIERHFPIAVGGQ